MSPVFSVHSVKTLLLRPAAAVCCRCGREWAIATLTPKQLIRFMKHFPCRVVLHV